MSELEQRVNARCSPRVPVRRGGRTRSWASPPRHSRAAKTRVWDFKQPASINLKGDAPRTPRSYQRISRCGYEVASKVTLGARDYDAQIGRWVSKDPILFGGRQGNLYLYANGDPVNRSDPRGEFALNGCDVVALGVTAEFCSLECLPFGSFASPPGQACLVLCALGAGWEAAELCHPPQPPPPPPIPPDACSVPRSPDDPENQECANPDTMCHSPPPWVN